ncbi:RNA polymerase II-associated protein RBA50 [Escovopsis weberi]|uniref:RNA polymerase II-associated protein RBA50 n=1 Tax=Escovopsis weberi TaxID=150374 RepID=A0A0M9VSA8_ESCWE|nr:RNA polymerase II-associated protein RBA50 [Escovopsis weberi]
MDSLLIGDILERDHSDKKPAEPPSAPAPGSATGFPQHKRRWKPSAFKQQRAGGAAPGQQKPPTVPIIPAAAADGANTNFEEVERRRIDQENRQKIDNMTPQEIARAQEDLLNGLNPDLIQRLLRRANIDEPDPSSPFNIPIPAVEPPQPQPQPQSQPDPTPPKSEVDGGDNPDTSEPRSSSDVKPQPPQSSPPTRSAQSSRSSASTKKIADNYNEDQAPAQIPPDLFPIVDLPRTTHFPVPPSLPDLDPSDPNFLATLHEKYFPSLPADPSKLAWMAPVPTQDSVADRESPYYPHPEISVAALRFDFRGRFLSPRVSRGIPTSRGLHHHGEAPEAAGYTVAELARLARSAVPAQRCMAFQTLGRILYRLGRGEWGAGVGDPIAMGVWGSVKEGRVLETLMDAGQGEGGHRGSRAYALEALWLFEKGGWREKSQGR